MYRKIVLAGGSGYLGKTLIEFYRKNCEEIIVLSRGKPSGNGNVRYVSWDGKTLGDWYKELEFSDMLFNLSGKNVNCRYTPENRKEIIRSRIEPTRVLAEAILQLDNPPKLWVNSGSATIYRHAEDCPQDEENGELGYGFSVDVCKAWENAFWETETPGTRKALLRIGMVLGRDDSVFPYLRTLVYTGLGGYQGTGNQYLSWIHQQDFVRIVEWLNQNKTQSGTFNCTAPGAVTNQTFMRFMRQAFGISFGIPSPKWLLEIGAAIIGTETELVLKSRWVYPKRLLDAGFRFSFPKAQTAINELASSRL
jgi:uncharacterized protein